MYLASNLLRSRLRSTSRFFTTEKGRVKKLAKLFNIHMNIAKILFFRTKMRKKNSESSISIRHQFSMKDRVPIVSFFLSFFYLLFNFMRLLKKQYVKIDFKLFVTQTIKFTLDRC